MAIVRSADPAALTVGEVRDQARTARRRYLRRWLPIGIGLLMAAAMVVMAAAAPLIAPLSPSAQFSDAVLKGRVSSSVTCSGRTSSGGTS